MDYKIYEDKPHTDIWMKGILLLPSAILLVTAITLWQESLQATLYLIAGALLIGLVFIFIIPIKYCIFNTKIRIKFRGPFAFNIPFETVTDVREPRWFTAGINLPTNMSQSSTLEIARKGRMPVNITPADKQAFVSNFDKAFNDWKQGKDI
ncbi:MAG: hypothetical protein ABSA18_10525 [Dehalococcoidia bacterium]|jgi:hypothetical protein